MKNRGTSYVFTVSMPECEKPIIWVQMVTEQAVNDQETAAQLILDYWCNMKGFDLCDLDESIEDLAYNMRKIGCGRAGDITFELTEVDC